MAIKSVECWKCGEIIPIGGEFLRSNLTDRHRNRFFCSEKCLREHLIDTLLDDVLDDWIEENAEYCELEASDPYDRYGVNRSDF